MSNYLFLCSIKHCERAAESLKLYGMEFCSHHQSVIGTWLVQQEIKGTQLFRCPSYYDEDNTLQDCTCGRCEK